MPTADNTVIIIDDDPSILKLLETTIRSVGPEPACFFDPNEAIKSLLDPANVVCIFIDWHLDGEDGIELIQPLHDKFPLSPIIVMSADASSTGMLRALQAGAFTFWRKTDGLIQLMTPLRCAISEYYDRVTGTSVRTLDEIEAEAIRAAMVRSRGVWEQAARELGIHSSTLRRKVQKLGIA